MSSPDRTMSNHDDSYQAIACADHSQYELWIMHAQSLRLTWQNTQGQEQVDTLRPRDLQTRAGQEFLIATPIGSEQRIEIRLDHILHCKPVSSRNAS